MGESIVGHCDGLGDGGFQWWVVWWFDFRVSMCWVSMGLGDVGFDVIWLLGWVCGGSWWVCDSLWFWVCDRFQWVHGFDCGFVGFLGFVVNPMGLCWFCCFGFLVAIVVVVVVVVGGLGDYSL